MYQLPKTEFFKAEFSQHVSSNSIVIREDERRRVQCNLRLSYTQCVSKVRSRFEEDMSRQEELSGKGFTISDWRG